MGLFATRLSTVQRTAYWLFLSLSMATAVALANEKESSADEKLLVAINLLGIYGTSATRAPPAPPPEGSPEPLVK